MKTMKERNEVRRLFHIEGRSIRAISRETGMHRMTVSRILAEGGPVSYQRQKDPDCPVLGPFKAVIDEILEQDVRSPRKQRHTAARIHERLRQEHGYAGGYTQVREYVAQARNLRKGAYVPLEFGPGEAQVDWGQAVAFDQTREPPEKASAKPRTVYLFIMTLPFSDARFVAASVVEFRP